MSEPGTAIVTVESVALGVVSASTPTALVARATDAANALAGVIEAKKLFANISGRKFVKCEGWTTLAAMMGVLPREAGMHLREDGGYEATVELVRISDGIVLTRASAECGPDEPTWKNRAAYARRSMAATRATSKACRLAFSWVMALAGYEVTPLDEMPPEEVHPPKATKPPTAKELSEPPKALQTPEPDPLNPQEKILKRKGHPATALRNIGSTELLAVRAKIKTEGTPEQQREWIDAIDTVLSSREGL
jgi:hypothetical protein